MRNFFLDSDPKLLFRIRIQQKMKEKIKKNFISNFRPVNSGLSVGLFSAGCSSATLDVNHTSRN